MRQDSNSPRRGRARRKAYVGAAIAALAAGGALATTGASAASVHKRDKVCSGSFTKPGVLAGTIKSNVVVKGACEVNHGSAKVKGSVTVTANGVLVAASGHNDKTKKGHSNLTISGNLVVGKGATAVLGCEAAHFPCIDDNQKAPTLSNKVKIGGNVTASGALGVIIHVAKIGGKVTVTGGGGGVSCSSTPSVFALFKSPQYSDFEDDSIAGRLSISNLGSCWLGVLRDHIGGSFTLTNTKMADPDAIEIGDNVIAGNLACTGNTNAVPVSVAVWDTTDISQNAIYPRAFKPNTVKGTRSGQCVKSTPTTQGGAFGAAGTF